MPSTHRSLVIALGVAAAVVVAADGSLGWIVVRVLLVALITAGPVALERRPDLVRWADATVGLAGVVVGVGIGVSHLVRGGDPVSAVAGTVVLVAGLGLIVTATAAIVAPGSWPVRAGGVAAALAVTAVVSIVAVPAIMATNVPPIAAGDRTPSSLGVDFEQVSFETDDGVRIAGWYVPSGNGAAVVLRHGAGSTRDDVLDQLGVLVAHGYGVLATDARGHGASGGRAMDFGWYGDSDVSAAVDFLAGRPDIDPDRIGVVGLSMGGEEAIGAAAADRRVRAVVAEGATGRQAADDDWLSDRYGVRGSLQEGLNELRTELTALLTAAPRPTPLADAIAAAEQASVLVVAAGLVADEREVATVLRGVAPDRVTVWIVDGAGHTDGLATAPQAWAATVIGFLDDALAVRP